MHLGIDEVLAGDGGQAADPQPSAFLDRLGPVVARVVSLVSVEDKGFVCRWFEVEGLLPATILHARFEMATPRTAAFARVVVDFHGAATDGFGLELFDYRFGVFCAGEVDEAIGRVSAGEGVNGHIQVVTSLGGVVSVGSTCWRNGEASVLHGYLFFFEHVKDLLTLDLIQESTDV